MGQPGPYGSLYAEYIGIWGEPGELKHLSNRRKGHQPRLRQQWRANADQASGDMILTGTVWKVGPQWVRAPYGYGVILSLSRAGHVKSCLNMGGPPSKPKYSYATDSELVPVSYTHLTLPTILLVQISVVAGSLKKKKNWNALRPHHNREDDQTESTRI
eukprot:TRINITY_DN8560_c0_g2_i1.p1 TRINITY_DN8560_c0_g2~~TRINITY_DN8560_c0_g2_i1.p1  ORF type:complete len:159 (-),score=3.41 TRINITY_DN8560_c0_g2_i1:26-502(-)